MVSYLYPFQFSWHSPPFRQLFASHTGTSDVKSVGPHTHFCSKVASTPINDDWLVLTRTESVVMTTSVIQPESQQSLNSWLQRSMGAWSMLMRTAASICQHKTMGDASIKVQGHMEIGPRTCIQISQTNNFTCSTAPQRATQLDNSINLLNKGYRTLKKWESLLSSQDTICQITICKASMRPLMYTMLHTVQIYVECILMGYLKSSS